MSRSSSLEPSSPRTAAPLPILSGPASTEEVTKHHHRIPESGTMPVLDHVYVPTFLRCETLHRIFDIFDEALGSELEYRRTISQLGAAPDTVPRRLAGPLLIALSRKLHPERRAAFLKDVCQALSDYEGTPCVLV